MYFKVGQNQWEVSHAQQSINGGNSLFSIFLADAEADIEDIAAKLANVYEGFELCGQEYEGYNLTNISKVFDEEITININLMKVINE